MKRTLGLMLLSLVIIQTTTGCRSSEDRSIYKSTFLEPKSVYVVTKPGNKTIWTYDIPPQTQLVAEFDGPGNASVFGQTKDNPTLFMWSLYPIDATNSFFYPEKYLGSPIESGTIELDGGPVIIGMAVRPPIDPETIPTDRTIEEIEKDLPATDDLPEPDQPAESEAEEQELTLPEPDAN